MGLFLFNTLTRKIEKFYSISKKEVRLYCCGPTVYDNVHIGNLRTYIFEDFLKRALLKIGYSVNHVINITDVGHLETDIDYGRDKIDLASKKKNKSPWKIAKYYEDLFFLDFMKLNLLYPKIVCKATDHIQDMQSMIKIIKDKGFSYIINGNMYFKISKFQKYNDLSKVPKKCRYKSYRVKIDKMKKNQLDFVLWFSNSKFVYQIMRWSSPWGIGFPGWHIECSAMAAKYLGSKIDIHVGGVDHISVHHTNEKAQSEVYFGFKWVNFWIHGEFLIFNNAKMSKSTGKYLTIRELEKQGFSALHYKYLCFSSHYRSQLLFTFEALNASKKAFELLRNRIIFWKMYPEKRKSLFLYNFYKNQFWNSIFNDLNTPKALSIIWRMSKDREIGNSEKLELLEEFDSVLGFNISNFFKSKLNKKKLFLIKERECSRKNKEYNQADKIRIALLKKGIMLKDLHFKTDWYLL